MTTKTFPIADVIAAYEGATLKERQFDNVAAVYNHISGQNLMAAQVGTEHPKCSAILAKQHPFLTTLRVPARDNTPNYSQQLVDNWLAGIETKYGKTLKVAAEPGYATLNHMDGIPDEALHKTYVVGQPETEG